MQMFSATKMTFPEKLLSERQPKKRGPRKGEGGRPKGPEKVQLSTWVLPETLTAIDLMGERGKVIDDLVKKHTNPINTKSTTP